MLKTVLLLYKLPITRKLELMNTSCGKECTQIYQLSAYNLDLLMFKDTLFVNFIEKLVYFTIYIHNYLRNIHRMGQFDIINKLWKKKIELLQRIEHERGKTCRKIDQKYILPVFSAFIFQCTVLGKMPTPQLLLYLQNWFFAHFISTYKTKKQSFRFLISFFVF